MLEGCKLFGCFFNIYYPGTFWCLQAALTIAAAIPALIALGYSFACEVFHEPSAFFLIKQPVGALGLSNFFNYSASSLPMLTDISLFGFLVTTKSAMLEVVCLDIW